jgi:hypothetical protein
MSQSLIIGVSSPEERPTTASQVIRGWISSSGPPPALVKAAPEGDDRLEPRVQSIVAGEVPLGRGL